MKTKTPTIKNEKLQRLESAGRVYLPTGVVWSPLAPLRTQFFRSRWVLNAGQVSVVRRDAWRARLLSLPTVGDSAFAYRAHGQENRRAGVRFARSSPLAFVLLPLCDARVSIFYRSNTTVDGRVGRRRVLVITKKRFGVGGRTVEVAAWWGR